MKTAVAHGLRRVAHALIQQSDKLDPPAEKSPAQQALDMFNASIRLAARDAAYSEERARIDAQYHAQMAMLR